MEPNVMQLCGTVDAYQPSLLNCYGLNHFRGLFVHQACATHGFSPKCPH